MSLISGHIMKFLILHQNIFLIGDNQHIKNTDKLIIGIVLLLLDLSYAEPFHYQMVTYLLKTLFFLEKTILYQ